MIVEPLSMILPSHLITSFPCESTLYCSCYLGRCACSYILPPHIQVFQIYTLLRMILTERLIGFHETILSMTIEEKATPYKNGYSIAAIKTRKKPNVF